MLQLLSLLHLRLPLSSHLLVVVAAAYSAAVVGGRALTARMSPNVVYGTMHMGRADRNHLLEQDFLSKSRPNHLRSNGSFPLAVLLTF